VCCYSNSNSAELLLEQQHATAIWRNLRTHTLHDPVGYKIRELGDWELNRQLPKPSFYS
jgi:hypothetical protein